MVACCTLSFGNPTDCLRDRKEIILHHDRYGRAVSDCCIPGYEAFLCDSWGKIAWREDKAPLATTVLRIAKLCEGVFDALGGCSGDERVIMIASFLEFLANMFEKGDPFGIGDCDCFAG